jgi:hypothetical protein
MYTLTGRPSSYSNASVTNCPAIEVIVVTSLSIQAVDRDGDE